ncbi:MAG: twin-arginine translocation pathway signal protein [Pseudomonadota bacterium]
MRRRNFLFIASGGVIAAAGTSMGVVASRKPATATAPWTYAQHTADNPVVNALRYALLAPNPHNIQPWLVDISVPGEVALFINPVQLLPHTDPYSRQITIGLGCFIELFDLAAQSQGYRADIELFPQGSDIYSNPSIPVMHARLVADTSISPDPLFRYALARRSNKEPFDTDRPIADADLADLDSAVRFGTGFGVDVTPERVDFLRQLTVDAMRIELSTPRTYKESVDLFRIGAEEIDASPDGIDLGGPMFELLKTFGMFSQEQALDQSTTAYAQSEKAILDTIGTAMGHLWLVTEQNERVDQIKTGRDWLRINLATTAAGLSMHPLSQALQEYPEMSTRYRTIHAELAPNGGTVQMLARIGYGTTVDPSPRWPLEKKLVKT